MTPSSFVRRTMIVATLIGVAAASMAQVPQNRAALAGRLGLSIDQLDRLEAVRGLGDQAMSQVPRRRIRALLLEMQYPNMARRRAAFRRLQAVNETGQIPETGVENAVRQLDLMRVRAIRDAVGGMPVGAIRGLSSMALRLKAIGRVSARGVLPPTAGLNQKNTGWTWLGPGNIGGRTRALAIDPVNPQSIWAASVGGGVWHSSDGGASFAPVDERMANLVVSTLAVDPTNPQNICAGTGEGYFNGDVRQGAGVFCTTDGKTWTVLPSTSNANFQYVNRLAINATGTVMLAATRMGLFQSAKPGWSAWSRVEPGEIAGVTFHPTDPKLAVANGLKNGTAYYSTDAGAMWHPATHAGVWQGRVELAYARKNPASVYASVNNGVGEVWRSDDGGMTYTRRKGLSSDGRAVPFLGTQGWYGNVIWAGDPVSSDLVLVGGVDLWKSLDGGDTFVDISSWLDDSSAHADHHVIAAHPKYDGALNRIVYFGNDGGVFRADDLYTVGNDATRKSGWTRLNNDYGVTQFYGAAGSARTGTIVGGTQDNGTVVYSKSAGPQKWTSMYGGDGGWAALDVTNERFMYGEYVYLNVHRSTDGGRSADFVSGMYWDGRDWAWKPPPFSIPDAQTESALFIAPFVLDPRNPHRILAGGLDLWRTNDARTPSTDSSGPRWASVKASVGWPISTITISPSSSDVVWVGHVNGDVYRSDNATSATPSWVKLDDGTSSHLPGRYVMRISVDPRDPATVYVSFGGFSGGNIWKTTDAGKSWNDVTHGLPGAPIRAIALHPDKPGYVYLGTEVGVFASDDGGATWSPTNEGPTNCSVEQLFWLDKTLVAVTHGRGLFSINLP